MSNENNGKLPYRLRNQFLSSPELALMRALEQMVEDRYMICPKVALNDIFYILRPNENVHFYNKIFRKHVDFLLCDPKTMKPAFGVELAKPVVKDETRASDQFIEDLFLTAGLPLVHVPSNDRYKITDLVHLFQLAALKAKENSPTPLLASDSVPLCPNCGLLMVLRIHRDGSQEGTKYYGCINSPACDGLVPIE